MTQVDGSVSVRPGRPMPAGRRSGRIVITAAAGLGLFAGLAGAAVAALLNQGRTTVRAIEQSAIEQSAIEAAVPDGPVPPDQSDQVVLGARPVPVADGVYLPDGCMQSRSVTAADFGPGRPLSLAMLGDSTAVGYGARSADEVPGVGLARGIAAALNRPVVLRTHGLSGCGASDLGRQLAEALPGAPDLVVIVVGGNDIRNKVPPGRSAEDLGAAVAALRAQRIPVVVGTCPDFGVIEPIPQPLRTVLHTWSMLLATLQERAVLAAGGRSVAIGRIVSPGFAHHPELFAHDHFHPSGAGYARAVAALLPVAIDELRHDGAGHPAAGIVA